MKIWFKTGLKFTQKIGLKSGLKFIKKFVEKCCKICLKFINILPIDKYEKNDMLYPRGAYILA